jgi:hypothetical protein
LDPLVAGFLDYIQGKSLLAGGEADQQGGIAALKKGSRTAQLRDGEACFPQGAGDVVKILHLDDGCDQLIDGLGILCKGAIRHTAS